jgi:hypothetical protein
MKEDFVRTSFDLFFSACVHENVLYTLTFYGALCYLLLPHGRALCYLYLVCPEVVRGSKSLQIVGTYHYAQEDGTNKTSSEALKRRSIRIITPKHQISLCFRRMFWK